MIFVVHAPVPYTHRSGGVRALYELAHQLRIRQHDIGIASIGPPRKHDPAPHQLPDAATWPRDKLDEAIHIYPEIVATNKLKEHKIVRWLLNQEKHRPRNDELQLVWTPHLKPDKQRLTVNIVEQEIFYPKTEDGSGILWYGGKGARFARDVPIGAIQLTHKWPATRAEMADELRKADQLISFDGFSAINLESAICGTPVLIPDGIGAQRIADPLFPLPGVAFGESEWDWARNTVSQAAEIYRAATHEMDGLIDRFVDSCGDYFRER